ncbi:protein kinase [Actinoallomurus sp. NPDC050550]|uniref:serine/threonine-protein kinase n=1 Tax=Actinoallomurus sp. NPDC050550 TaxID=3154937 RepID=UPI0033C544F4
MRSLQQGDPASVGPYQLIARLGEGGMGTVFLARSPGARLTALKLIKREYAADPEFRARFRREITAASRVSGLYTAPIQAADADALQPWFTAAYIPAPTLDEAVTAIGPLPEPAVRALGAGLAEALQAIHAAGLVHRDLKPGNILLAEDGPKIIDFGVAKAGDATQLTGTGGMLGTLAYMAPEQIAGSKDVGPAADVFSLGGVLVHAATGRKPFGERDEAALLYELMYGEPELHGVPGSLHALLAACLAKEPARRPRLEDVLAKLAPADPQALLSPALREAVTAKETEAHQVASGPIAVPPPLPQVGVPRRRVLGLTAIGAVAVAGVGGGTAAWALTRTPEKSARPAPRGTALATAPPPAWTFTPPTALTDEAYLLVTGDVVLFGGTEGIWGLDAQTGRQLWTHDIPLGTWDSVHDSRFLVTGGHDQLLNVIDATTGHTTTFHTNTDKITPGDIYGVIGNTVVLKTMGPKLTRGPVIAVDLTSGRTLWHYSAGDVDPTGAVDQTTVYINDKPALVALDPATGRKRWTYTWPKDLGGRDWDTFDITAGGGRVFGNFGGALQAVDATSGKALWSQPTDPNVDLAYDTVFLSGTDVIYKGTDLRAYDQATGKPKWTLYGPEPLASTGHVAVADGLIAAAFGGYSGYPQGFFTARTDGRLLWTHWGPATSTEDWAVKVAGSSVFATDQRRAYCFRAGG